MNISPTLLSDEIKAPASRLKELIEACVHELSQAENTVHNKRKVAALSRESIIEKMGELSGLSVKTSKLSDRFKEIIRNEVDSSWDLWLTTLQEELKQQWSGQVENETAKTKEELVKSYSQKLNQELTENLENWLHEVTNKHLNSVKFALNTVSFHLSVLSENISGEFSSKIMAEIDDINSHIGIQKYWKEKPLEPHNLELELTNFAGDIWENVMGIIDNPVFNSVAEIAKNLPFNNQKEEENKPIFSITKVVFEVGWKNFVSSKNKLMNRIEEFAVLIVDTKIKPTKIVIDQTISLYCEILDLQALYQQETPEQQQAEKTWIVETRQQLEQICNQLEAMLNEASSS